MCLLRKQPLYRLPKGVASLMTHFHDNTHVCVCAHTELEHKNTQKTALWSFNQTIMNIMEQKAHLNDLIEIHRIIP